MSRHLLTVGHLPAVHADPSIIWLVDNLKIMYTVRLVRSDTSCLEAYHMVFVLGSGGTIDWGNLNNLIIPPGMVRPSMTGLPPLYPAHETNGDNCSFHDVVSSHGGVQPFSLSSFSSDHQSVCNRSLVLW